MHNKIRVFTLKSKERQRQMKLYLNLYKKIDCITKYICKISVSVFLGLSLCCFTNLMGQDLYEQEETLSHLLMDLRSAQNNEQKRQANSAFKEVLEQTIRMPGAFQYPFDRLTTLGSITSPDTVFRLFNWNIEQDDLTQLYFCYILVVDARKKNYHVIELKDNSLLLPPKPSEILSSDEWYGALYYKIIPIKRGTKVVYTLLGWDGNNSTSTMKIIDVLTFSGNTARLGSPIFKVGRETHKRIFFEFAKKTTMYLSYEPQYNRIIFDHLSPEAPALEGLYSMYLPDLSYDAFMAEKGKWILVEDVVGINTKESDYIMVSYMDTKTGNVKDKKIKNKWEKPSESHVATLPEDEPSQDERIKDQVNDKNELQNSSITKQKTKKQGHTPQSFNPIDGSGKKYKKNKRTKKKKINKKHMGLFK